MTVEKGYSHLTDHSIDLIALSKLYKSKELFLRSHKLMFLITLKGTLYYAVEVQASREGLSQGLFRKVRTFLSTVLFSLFNFHRIGPMGRFGKSDMYLVPFP